MAVVSKRLENTFMCRNRNDLLRTVQAHFKSFRRSKLLGRRCTKAFKVHTPLRPVASPFLAASAWMAIVLLKRVDPLHALQA